MKFEQTIVKENRDGKMVEKEVHYSIDGNKVEKEKFYFHIYESFSKGGQVKGEHISEKTIDTSIGKNNILSMDIVSA
jgi:hypothetical protein